MVLAALTSYTAKPMVSRSMPSFLSWRLFFCISAITTLHTSSSSSASSSFSLNCGLVQNVSADWRVRAVCCVSCFCFSSLPQGAFVAYTPASFLRLQRSWVNWKPFNAIIQNANWTSSAAKNTDLRSDGLTDVVPAASSSGATDPASLEHVDLPVALCAVRQGVRSHVADLHLVVVLLEVLKLHPGVTRVTQNVRQRSKGSRPTSRDPSLHPTPRFEHIVVIFWTLFAVTVFPQ